MLTGVLVHTKYPSFAVSFATIKLTLPIVNSFGERVVVFPDCLYSLIVACFVPTEKSVQSVTCCPLTVTVTSYPSLL